MSRQSQGKVKTRSRHGQDKVKTRSGQVHGNLMGFDTIEITLVLLTVCTELGPACFYCLSSQKFRMVDAQKNAIISNQGMSFNFGCSGQWGKLNLIWDGWF